MKTIFFGSGQFPLLTFQKLLKLPIVTNLSLVTVPNHSFKEKNAIKDFASKSQLKIHQPNMTIESEQFKQELIEKPDLGLVCNYGYMIPSTIIDHFNKGVFVIHPSLLPKYRGAAPIQRAIMNNESTTGVSFIEISKNKFDAGAILLQKQLPILQQERYKEVSHNLSNLCSDCIEEFIMNIDTLPRIIQNVNETTKAPKLTQNDSKVDFNKNALQILNQFRAIYGTVFHSLKLKYMDKEIYVENLTLPNQQEEELLSIYQNAQNGTIWLLKNKQYKNFIYIKCNQNTWLKLLDFRFIDRGGSQAVYTFKNQFMMNFKFDSLENNYQFE